MHIESPNRGNPAYTIPAGLQYRHPLGFVTLKITILRRCIVWTRTAAAAAPTRSYAAKDL